MHSIVFSYGPYTLADEFIKNYLNRDYLLCNNEDYVVSQTRLTFLNQFPLVSFPIPWNRLDLDIKTISSNHIFKFRTKQFFS